MSEINTIHDSALKELRKQFPKDDVFTSLAQRLLYAHDASAYRIVPKGIVFPRTKQDIVFLIDWAKKHSIGLTFRSAGTSLSGQAVGEGLIIDCSKYWKDCSFNSTSNLVTVQSGIIGGHVNRILAKHQRKIGPDPASINACMMGGILANNASGMCCGIEFNSYHTISSIECILADGNIFDSALPNADDVLKQFSKSLYDGIISIRDRIRESDELSSIIRKKYRLKNTVGYCLNAFLDEYAPSQIIKRLLIGSEGTLGFISKATLHTLPALPFASTAMLFFHSMDAACSAIPTLSNTHPAALEIMDRQALRSIEKQEGAPSIISNLGHDATAILIEYQSSELSALQDSIQSFHDIQHSLSLIEAPHFTTDVKTRNQYWKIRKGMFPSIGASRAKGTGIINEDIAVPIHSLSDAVRDLRRLFTAYHFDEAIIFGHAKEGNLHFVIAHAFDTKEDIEQFGAFMQDLSTIIIDTYDGSMKAEHGTGRNIAPFVAHEWGEEAYALMKEVKNLFDPNGILNPGIIINDDPLAHVQNVKSFPIVHDIIDTCIECGYCESHCPTHHSTLSPRQRIILDREIKLVKDETVKHELMEFASFHQIDSCATDGLCSLACPVTINTGEYMLTKRAETNKMLGKSYHKAAKHIEKRDATIRAGLKIGHVVSNIIGGKQLQSLTGFLSHIVQIPQWIPGMPDIRTTISHMNPNADIFYIPSCTTRFFTKPKGALQSLPELVMSLAQQSGITISIPSSIEERCCGLAFDSKGDTESGNIAMDRWKQDIPSNAMLLTDAYSCQAHIQQSMKTIDIIDFAELVLDSLNIQPMEGTAILHPPCSLQMQHGVQRLKAIAERCATEVFIPESLGCCGFAGDHGFHHPELVVHACKDMRAEISAQRNVLGYYSINPTCELGMQIGTGNVYRSILYLIDQAIKP